MKAFKTPCLCALWTMILVCACDKPDPESNPVIDITTPETVIAGDLAETATITFTANNPWTVSSSEEWCRVSPTSGEASKKAATVTVSLDQNNTFEARSATVTIKAGGIEKTVTIIQKAGPRPATYVSHKWLTDYQGNYLTGDRGITIGPEEVTLGINFVSNLTAKDLILVVTTGGDWIYQSHNIEYLDGDTFRTSIHIKNNPSPDQRMGYVQISSADETEGYSIEIIQEGSPAITPPQAVDLGLSVLWGDRNLGADNPSDFGNYYAWGEPATKSSFDWGNYKWANGSKSSLTKYNTRSECGEVDNATRLLKEDDAAYAATNGEWRMPTREDLEELLSSCNWETATLHTESGDFFGYTVKSKTNDNSIFLPAAGCMEGRNPDKVNEYGLYPSSDVCTAENNRYGYMDDYCWYLFFQYGEKIIYGDSRARGWAIRPVKDK